MVGVGGFMIRWTGGVSNCDMLSVEIVEYKYFDCLLAQHCLATFNQIG